MEFEGVYPAIITPLDKKNKFKEDIFRKIVEFNINSGAHGFWVSGGAKKNSPAALSKTLRNNKGMAKNVNIFGACGA